MHPSRTAGRWVRRHRLHIGVSALLCYLSAIALCVVVFPDVSNLWVSIFVLLGGGVQSLLGVADLIDDGDKE